MSKSDRSDLFDRWSKLEDERDALSERLLALGHDMRAAGFDAKVLRAEFREHREREKASAK